MNDRGSSNGGGTLGAAAVAVSLLFAGAGLVGGTALLRGHLPAGGSPDERVEIKLAHLREHPGRYDTLFIGSSRTFRGFVPSVFDAATAAAGRPTRSFNLGVPGSRALETLRLVERVGRIQPGGWSTIFVDPEGFEVLLDEGNYLSRAVIDWHDLETTRLVSNYIRASQGGREGTDEKLRMHALSCAYNLAGIGRALPWVDELLGVQATPEWRAETLGPKLDGYAERERELRRGQKQRAEEYRERVADLNVQNDELERDAAARAAPEPLEVYRAIQGRIEALGARPIFVAQPGMYLNRDLVLGAAAGELETLLRFDRPAQHPELYEFEARYDFNHLNHEGAERFTRLLAATFLGSDDPRRTEP